VRFEEKITEAKQKEHSEPLDNLYLPVILMIYFKEECAKGHRFS